ncbi:MAG: WXG100 family type VII secretion target [Ruminococcus sp.]|nr:WXG100 family type VII secretion target [Ruminococcus sp.]
MATFSYDLDAMSNIANQLTDLVQEWDVSKESLYTIYEELDAMWDGHANDNFNEKFVTEDKQKYQKLSEVMNTYINLVKKAIERYTNAEEEVSNIVNQH